MRKITEQSVNAFLNGHNMSKQNMTVSHHAGYSEMFLHGNKIAERNKDGIFVTLAGWPSVTTRERLHALCIACDSPYAIAQRNHKQMLLNRRDLSPVRELDNYEYIQISEAA